MKKLGVIGGMGPAATALFYQYINQNTSVSTDQENLPMVILNDCTMPDRTKAVLGSDDDKRKIIDKLVLDADYLKYGGCDAIAITCNTCHYFIDSLEQRTDLKVFNMINFAVEAALRRCSSSNNRVALLATDGTVQTKIYQRALETKNLQVWTPSDELQKRVTYLIYDIVKAGRKINLEDWRVIDDAIKSANCACAILGCTELSVIGQELSLPDFYIDSMKELALGCIREFK